MDLTERMGPSNGLSDAAPTENPSLRHPQEKRLLWYACPSLRMWVFKKSTNEGNCYDCELGRSSDERRYALETFSKKRSNVISFEELTAAGL